MECIVITPCTKMLNHLVCVPANRTGAVFSGEKSDASLKRHQLPGRPERTTGQHRQTDGGSHGEGGGHCHCRCTSGAKTRWDFREGGLWWFGSRYQMPDPKSSWFCCNPKSCLSCVIVIFMQRSFSVKLIGPPRGLSSAALLSGPCMTPNTQSF